MSSGVFKATGVVLVMNLAVKLLGFIRETVIANYFGTSVYADAYLVAYTIPYFFQWVIGAALVAAVVPALAKHLMRHENDEAWYVASSIFNLTILIMGALSIIGIAGAWLCVKLIAPGYSGDVLALTITLTRIMMPATVIMSAAMVLTGLLNACHNFAAPAFAPGLGNLIIIGGMVFFANSYGIMSLGWATLISYFGYLLIQLPSLKRAGFRYRLVLGLKHPDVRRVLADVLPISLGVAVNQIYFALNRVFASALAVGTIAALNYGNKLMMMPLGLFVGAVATAFYPALAEQAIDKDKSQMSGTLEKGIGFICLVAVPAAVGLAVLREPIVQLLFERGEFDHAATLATAAALLAFVVGLVPMAVNMLLVRAFFSLKDVKTTVWAGLFSVAVNVLLSLLLYRAIPFGGGGLAVSNSLAALSNTIWLYVVLRGRHAMRLNGRGLAVSFAKMTAASAVMGFAVWLIYHFTFPVLGLIAAVGLAIITGCLIYAVLLLVLGVDELSYGLAKVKARLTKKAKGGKIVDN